MALNMHWGLRKTNTRNQALQMSHFPTKLTIFNRIQLYEGSKYNSKALSNFKLGLKQNQTNSKYFKSTTVE